MEPRCKFHTCTLSLSFFLLKEVKVKGWRGGKLLCDQISIGFLDGPSIVPSVKAVDDYSHSLYALCGLDVGVF